MYQPDMLDEEFNRPMSREEVADYIEEVIIPMLEEED